MSDSWRQRYAWSDISDDSANPEDKASVTASQALLPHVPSGTQTSDTPNYIPEPPGHTPQHTANTVDIAIHSHIHPWRLNYSWGDISNSPTSTSSEGDSNPIDEGSALPELVDGQPMGNTPVTYLGHTSIPKQDISSVNNGDPPMDDDEEMW